MGGQDVADLHQGGFDDRRLELPAFDPHDPPHEEFACRTRKQDSDDRVEAAFELEKDTTGVRIAAEARGLDPVFGCAHGNDDRRARLDRNSDELRQSLPSLNRAGRGEFYESIEVGFVNFVHDQLS